MTKQSKFEWEQPKLVIASPIHIYRTPQKKKTKLWQRKPFGDVLLV